MADDTALAIFPEVHVTIFMDLDETPILMPHPAVEGNQLVPYNPLPRHSWTLTIPAGHQVPMGRDNLPVPLPQHVPGMPAVGPSDVPPSTGMSDGDHPSILQTSMDLAAEVMADEEVDPCGCPAPCLQGHGAGEYSERVLVVGPAAVPLSRGMSDGDHPSILQTSAIPVDMHANLDPVVGPVDVPPSSVMAAADLPIPVDMHATLDPVVGPVDIPPSSGMPAADLPSIHWSAIISGDHPSIPQSSAIPVDMHANLEPVVGPVFVPPSSGMSAADLPILVEMHAFSSRPRPQ